MEKKQKIGWDILEIFPRPYWLPKMLIEWKECKRYFLVNGIKFGIKKGTEFCSVIPPREFNYSPYEVQKIFDFEMGIEVGIDTFRNTLIELQRIRNGNN